MPNHRMLSDLKDVFVRHTPSSSEDPAWAVVLKMQVLQLEVLEKIMSSIQDMKDATQKTADGLVALNTSVTAAIADGIGGSGGGVPLGTTVINSADQAILDSAVSQANSNSEKITEIQTALATATPPPQTPSQPASTPNPDPTSSSSPASPPPSTPPSAI